MMKEILPILMALALSSGSAFSQNDFASNTKIGSENSTVSETMATADSDSTVTEKTSANKKTSVIISSKTTTAAVAEASDQDALSAAVTMPTATAQDPLTNDVSVMEGTLPFESGPPQISMARTLGGMGLVLCLIVTAGFGIRRFVPGIFPRTSGGKNIRLIESLGMGDRRSVSLIEVGGSRYLLGSTPGSVNLLAMLPEHISLVAEDNLTESEKSHFRNLFDAEKKRSEQYEGNMPSENIRLKMRRLREALEQ